MKRCITAESFRSLGAASHESGAGVGYTVAWRIRYRADYGGILRIHRAGTFAVAGRDFSAECEG